MAGDITLGTILLALVGGVIPALLWLRFWIREDGDHPEPKAMITLAFLGGMVAVGIAYPLQKLVVSYVGIEENTFVLLLLWAAIEEIAKLCMFLLVSYRSVDFDEPMDGVIYLVTVSLGFSALENSLFLIDPISVGHGTMAIILGNYRFIGASLLHVICGAAIGTFLGMAFYTGEKGRRHALWTGLSVAILLHTAFNFSIMKSDGDSLYLVFGGLWLAAITLLLLCEIVRRVHPGLSAPPTTIVLSR
jgi:RsiW-degrading membrane proteinase PrsW (M82 family)